MKKAPRMLVYVILFSTLPVGIFFLLPTWVEYHVIESYSFSANEDEAICELAVMLPKSGAYQKIENVQVEWAGEVTRKQYEEVEVAILGPVAAKGDTPVAKLSYEVSLLQGKISWDSNIEEEDLLPQKYIEADTPEIIQAAEGICADKKRASAHNAYVFTAAYLSWPEGSRLGGDQSALTAYKSKIGVCGEFANLMTALSRVCGVPAKSMSGLFMPMFYPPGMVVTTTWNHPGGSHAWVEVYTGDHWTIADPSWASRMPFDRIWFGRSSGQYLSYGEVGDHERIYHELLDWGEEHGVVIGAMSAPLKFVAASSNKDVTIVPTVSVKKAKDNRWVLAVSLYILLAALSSVVERYVIPKSAPRSAFTSE